MRLERTEANVLWDVFSYMIWGTVHTDGLTMMNTSLLHILFTINTVKTTSLISAAAQHKERKEWKEKGERSGISLIPVS